MYQLSLFLPEDAGPDIEALFGVTCPVHTETTIDPEDGGRCAMCDMEETLMRRETRMAELEADFGTQTEAYIRLEEAEWAEACPDCHGKGIGCCINADIPLPGTDR